MNKILALLLTLALVVGCQKDKSHRISPDSPLYETAKELSHKVSFLDPDSNQVLANADIFEITAASLLHEMNTNLANDLGSLKELSANELKAYLKKYLDSYVNSVLIAASAKEKGISVTETEIDSILEHIYRNNDGKENFINMLNESGLTLESVTNDIKKSLISDRYLRKHVYSKLSITHEELKKAYNQDKTATVRHILLSTQDETAEEKAETLEKMKTILKKARQGENFVKLVRKYSEDPGSGENEGLYEKFERGMMVPEFDSASFSVPIGQISDIIETQFGYHILKVIERKRETRPFNQVKGELERRLLNDKKRMAYTEHLQELKKIYNYKLMIDP